MNESQGVEFSYTPKVEEHYVMHKIDEIRIGEWSLTKDNGLPSKIGLDSGSTVSIFPDNIHKQIQDTLKSQCKSSITCSHANNIIDLLCFDAGILSSMNNIF